MSGFWLQSLSKLLEVDRAVREGLGEGGCLLDVWVSDRSDCSPSSPQMPADWSWPQRAVT